jgi:RNA polymerase sigma-70 factor (ECF subfamily)
VRYRDNPVYELNKIAAVAHIEGANSALAKLEVLKEILGGYQPFHALRADLLRRSGRHADAVDAYEAALSLTASEADRAFLRQRRDEAAQYPRH